VRRLAVAVLALLALALAAASSPRADRRQLPCGLPDQGATAWIDYGWPSLAGTFGKPGVILAVSSGDFPAQMRQLGAGTIHWDMHLKNRVGIPSAPADPAGIVERANKLFDFAVQQSGCSTPLIAENELFGAGLTTPWSTTNEQYRGNVLTFLRTLAQRGARPFLLVNSAPYTDGDARDWWLQVAQVSDIVREVYPGAKALYGLGPIAGNRVLRTAMRNGIGDFTAIGIPPSKLGVMLGFQTTPNTGGRGGLEPASAWFRVAKWQALSARTIAKETGIATIWSWGWGQSAKTEMDPDKTQAACVWLWTRSKTLCDGPAAAGPDFVPSLTEGQIILPAGIQCRIGARAIATSQIQSLQRLTGDREIAYTAMLARITESPYASVTTKQILAAERAVVSSRFGGSRSAYTAALAQAGATVSQARGVLGDEIRRTLIERTLHVRTPSGKEVSTFYTSYPDLLARPVSAKPSPSWLGWQATGWAFDSIAPAAVFKLRAGRTGTVHSVEGSFKVKPTGDVRPLGTMPLSVVAPAIRSVLTSFARGAAFDNWRINRQSYSLVNAVCVRDDLPASGSVDLADYLPFLSTTG
jgi:hypothetical protein